MDWFSRCADVASILTFILILIAFICGIVLYVNYTQIIDEATDIVDEVIDSSKKYIIIIQNEGLKLQQWSKRVRKNHNAKDIEEVATNQLVRVPQYV